MNYLKRIILLLACLSLIFTLTTIKDTYSKYKTDLTGTTNIKVARWRILVNNKDIRNNSEISNVITPTFIENENIAENVIAPTSEGYFDIVIDCTDVDVSFSYELTTSINSNSSVTDLITTGYSINGQPKIDLSENTPITDTILKNNNPKTILLRIYIKWDDSSTNQMDNQADTKATLDNNNLAKLDVTLNFKQVA